MHGRYKILLVTLLIASPIAAVASNVPEISWFLQLIIDLKLFHALKWLAVPVGLAYLAFSIFMTLKVSRRHVRSRKLRVAIMVSSITLNLLIATAIAFMLFWIGHEMTALHGIHPVIIDPSVYVAPGQ